MDNLVDPRLTAVGELMEEMRKGKIRLRPRYVMTIRACLLTAVQRFVRQLEAIRRFKGGRYGKVADGQEAYLTHAIRGLSYLAETIDESFKRTDFWEVLESLWDTETGTVPQEPDTAA